VPTFLPPASSEEDKNRTKKTHTRDGMKPQVVSEMRKPKQASTEVVGLVTRLQDNRVRDTSGGTPCREVNTQK